MSDEDRRREARERLERVARDSEVVGASSLARLSRRVGEHFSGHDPAEERPDPVELWGRRIGRGLSLVGVVALAWWLGVQLRWW